MRLTWQYTLFFSLLVTIGMNSLDMMYHLATDTAVHLNYVAVKFTIIFLVVFLIAHLVGIGLEEGIVSSIGGPVIFYIYYTFATPTLDRSVFTLDEAVWYIVVHALALFIVYWLALNHVLKVKQAPANKFVVAASQSFLVAICVVASEMGLHMLFRTVGLVNPELRIFLYLWYALALGVFVLVPITVLLYSSVQSIKTVIFTGLIAGFVSEFLLSVLSGLSYSAVFALSRAILIVAFTEIIRMLISRGRYE
ncbi:MAG: hypothetical protein HY363_00615 [Candidatus Aenigmarchaeota archaeon]|nr:hypothetical protein [Candidatus Aenigmarchaeota archaeon]